MIRLVKYLLFALDNLKIDQKKALLLTLYIKTDIEFNTHLRDIVFGWGDIVDQIAETVDIFTLISAMIDNRLVSDFNLLVAYFIVSDMCDYTDKTKADQLAYWFDFLQEYTLGYDIDDWGDKIYHIEFDIVNYYNIGLGIGYQIELLEQVAQYLARGKTSDLDLYSLGHDGLMNAIVQLTYLWG